MWCRCAPARRREHFRLVRRSRATAGVAPRHHGPARLLRAQATTRRGGAAAEPETIGGVHAATGPRHEAAASGPGGA
jgi:hypothetical protein